MPGWPFRRNTPYPPTFVGVQVVPGFAGALLWNVSLGYGRTTTARSAYIGENPVEITEISEEASTEIESLQILSALYKKAGT